MSRTSFFNMRPTGEESKLVNGHSGCEVRILRTNTNIVVEKCSVNRAYNNRLRLQIEKQRMREKSNRLSFIRIPRILEEKQLDDRYCASMEYVYFHDCLTYFATASKPSIDRVVSMMLAFITDELEVSTLEWVSADVFLAKLDGVSRAIASRQGVILYKRHIERLSAILCNERRLKIPIGPCHGDLTFSNVLIASKSDSVALIDFLDSFVESPLMDIVKLRQDTMFNWTLCMAPEKVDRTRFVQIMRYIDMALIEEYQGIHWYKQYFSIIMQLNLLRIAPYVKEVAVDSFLLNALSRLEFAND